MTSWARRRPAPAGPSRCCGHPWRSPPDSCSSGWSARPSPRSPHCSPASSASPISAPSHSPSPWPPRPQTATPPTPAPVTCRRARHRRPLPPGQPRRPPRTARRIHHRASAHQGMHGPAPRRAPARTAPILRFKPVGVPEADQRDRLPSRGSTRRRQGRVARRHGLAPARLPTTPRAPGSGPRRPSGQQHPVTCLKSADLAAECHRRLHGQAGSQGMYLQARRSSSGTDQRRQRPDRPRAQGGRGHA